MEMEKERQSRRRQRDVEERGIEEEIKKKGWKRRRRKRGEVVIEWTGRRKMRKVGINKKRIFIITHPTLILKLLIFE